MVDRKTCARETNTGDATGSEVASRTGVGMQFRCERCGDVFGTSNQRRVDSGDYGRCQSCGAATPLLSGLLVKPPDPPLATADDVPLSGAQWGAIGGLVGQWAYRIILTVAVFVALGDRGLDIAFAAALVAHILFGVRTHLRDVNLNLRKVHGNPHRLVD